MAKKKAPAKRPAKTSEKTKKLATPKSNVRVWSKSPKVSNKQYNKSSTIRTNAAKLGIDMTDNAIKIKKENAAARAAGNVKIIKIRSGGAGIGGMFGVKNR
jgi:ribosomal protein S12